MTYAYIRDLPIGTEHYERVMDEVGRDAPDGLIVHLVAKREGGLRYIDVWESEAHWDKFHDDVLQPALVRAFETDERAPSPVEPVSEVLDVYDLVRP